jgi:hypothetical protein
MFHATTATAATYNLESTLVADVVKYLNTSADRLFPPPSEFLRFQLRTIDVEIFSIKDNFACQAQTNVDR